jgi:protein BUR2
MQIMYPPHVIAAAAFYFARKFTHTELPHDVDGKEWWEQYGVKIENLRGTTFMMVLIQIR